MHCTLYTVHCKLYTVHYTLFIVHYTLYIIYCSLYTIHRTLYTVLCTLYTVHCTLYTVHYTLFIVHYTPYTIHRTQYTVHAQSCVIQLPSTTNYRCYDVDKESRIFGLFTNCAFQNTHAATSVARRGINEIAHDKSNPRLCTAIHCCIRRRIRYVELYTI